MKAKQQEAASGDCLSLSGKLTLSLLWCCQTSKSVLSHKHTQTDTRWNFGWATTAGNRHRAELSCHVVQQHTPYMKMGTQQKCINPYSRTHTHTHTRASQAWSMRCGKSADIFHVWSLHRGSVLRHFLWTLIGSRWSNNFLNPATFISL